VCAICLKSPCDSRCPNAPEPKAVYTCKYCDEGIIAGDEYAEINGDYYHIDCLEGMTARELLGMFDVGTFTAQEESRW